MIWLLGRSMIELRVRHILMLDRSMIEHQVFDLLRRPVEVEFVVTRIHNDCDEEARFDVIRRLVIDLLYAASLSGFVF